MMMRNFPGNRRTSGSRGAPRGCFPSGGEKGVHPQNLFPQKIKKKKRQDFSSEKIISFFINDTFFEIISSVRVTVHHSVRVSGVNPH
jgi:hypothetical protein